MKKLLALILTLVLASTGLCAMADTADARAPLSGADGDAPPLIDAVFSLLGALKGGNVVPPADAGTDAATPEAAATADPSAWKTMADVLSLDTDGSEASWDDQYYIYIFDYAGTQWLIRAKFSPELNEAVGNVDFMADDRREQINAILAPCEIDLVLDLSTLAMPREELDQWIGKTGQEMLDAGFEYNGYTQDEKGVRVNMVYGDFQYAVTFAEALEMAQGFGEMPGNLGEATVAGIAFGGKSYNFNEMNYVAPEPAPDGPVPDGPVTDGPVAGGLSGGWTPAADPAVTDDLRAVFDGATEGLVGVSYVPVAYLGSQVVAGINHAFLAQATIVMPNAEPYYVIVYVYEDLQGHAEVMNIANFDVGSLCTYGAD